MSSGCRRSERPSEKEGGRNPIWEGGREKGEIDLSFLGDQTRKQNEDRRRGLRKWPCQKGEKTQPTPNVKTAEVVKPEGKGVWELVRRGKRERLVFRGGKGRDY